jgi:hypothetical protein
MTQAAPLQHDLDLDGGAIKPEASITLHRRL